MQIQNVGSPCLFTLVTCNIGSRIQHLYLQKPRVLALFYPLINKLQRLLQVSRVDGILDWFIAPVKHDVCLGRHVTQQRQNKTVVSLILVPPIEKIVLYKKKMPRKWTANQWGYVLDEGEIKIKSNAWCKCLGAGEPPTAFPTAFALYTVGLLSYCHDFYVAIYKIVCIIHRDIVISH